MLKATLQWILSTLFGIFDATVQIGISSDICKDRRHGVALVGIPNNGSHFIPFLVDNPDYLKNPSAAIIAALFHQIAKMGYYPKTLEIAVGDKMRVYEFGKSKPVLVQPNRLC